MLHRKYFFLPLNLCFQLFFRRQIRQMVGLSPCPRFKSSYIQFDVIIIPIGKQHCLTGSTINSLLSRRNNAFNFCNNWLVWSQMIFHHVTSISHNNYILTCFPCHIKALSQMMWFLYASMFFQCNSQYSSVFFQFSPVFLFRAIIILTSFDRKFRKGTLSYGGTGSIMRMGNGTSRAINFAFPLKLGQAFRPSNPTDRRNTLLTYSVLHPSMYSDILLSFSPPQNIDRIFLCILAVHP